MRTGNKVVLMSLFLLPGFIGLSSAAIVTDPTGDTIGLHRVGPWEPSDIFKDMPLKESKKA